MFKKREEILFPEIREEEGLESDNRQLNEQQLIDRGCLLVNKIRSYRFVLEEEGVSCRSDIPRLHAMQEELSDVCGWLGDKVLTREYTARYGSDEDYCAE